MAAPLVCLLFYLAINLQGIEAATTPPPTPNQETACSALQQIADRSSICTATSCTQLQCSVLGVSADITILPCAAQPSVSVAIAQDGREIYQHVFSRSEVVPITSPQGIPLLNLNVSLAVSPSQDSMILEVNANPLFGPSIPLVPRTTIPLSRSQCPHAVTSSRTSDASDTPSHATSNPTVPSSSVSQHPKTCQALQNIATGSASQCITVDSCSALDCNFMGQYHAKLTVKPCTTPPAVDVVITNAMGVVIADKTLTSSSTQPIEWSGIHIFDLVITISHMPSSIILSISVHSPTLPRDIVLVPNTTIPIDRCGCPGVTCSSDGPYDGTKSSSDGTRPYIFTNPTAGKSEQSTILKVAVPLGVIALLSVVITTILVVVGVAYFYKRKRVNAYNFQRVAFTNANGEEEEEEEG